MTNKFSILNGAKYFSSGIFQNYLVFIPAEKDIKRFKGTTRIDLEENIENITESDSNFAPTFIDHHLLPDTNFNGHCLINNIYIPKKVINIYVSFTLSPWLRNLNTDYTLKNCLFGSVKQNENAGIDKYKYSDYSIGFHSHSEFLFTIEAWEKMSLFLELI